MEIHADASDAMNGSGEFGLPEGSPTAAPPGLAPSMNTLAASSSTRPATLEHMRFTALASDYNGLPTYPVRPSYSEYHSKLHPSTRVCAYDGAPTDPHKPSSVPIYQTATFVQPSATEFGAYDYTRSGNPTRTALEKQVAMLEGAHAAFAFTTGMAALVAVTRLCAHVCSSGGGEEDAMPELIVGDDIYGGMHRLVSRVTSALHGVRVKFVDTTDLGQLTAMVTHPRARVRMVHIESPSNPLMRITDVRALAELLHAHNVLLSVDSTMMSPIAMRALALGADIVVHSATKHLGGHSDVCGGIVAVKSEAIAKKVAFFQNAEGTGLEPFSCWLFLRGIKTLAIRVERAQQNAQRVAEFLARHPLVTRVYYAGLKPDPADAKAVRAYNIHHSQCDGAGCVMSFTTGAVAISRRVIDALRLFKLTVSFGSVNSLCELPCTLSHASVPKELRTLPEDLIRLSIGIEHADDLIHDLEQALDLAGNALVENVRAITRRRGSSVVHGGDHHSAASSDAGQSINRADADSVMNSTLASLATRLGTAQQENAQLRAEVAAMKSSSSANSLTWLATSASIAVIAAYAAFRLAAR